MEKLPIPRKLKAVFRELGIATEEEFMEWRRSGRCPVIVRLGYPAPIIIPPALVEDTRVSDFAFRLYAQLGKMAVNSSIQMYQDDIARLLNRSRATVKRALTILRNTGWIDRKWIGFGFPNVIILNEKPNSTP